MSSYRAEGDRPQARSAPPWKRPLRALFVAVVILAIFGSLVLLAEVGGAVALDIVVLRAPIVAFFGAVLVLLAGAKRVTGRVPRPAALGLVLIAGGACFLPGCTSLDGAKIASNTSKDAFDAAQPIVHERCTKFALEAIDRVRSMPPGEERERAAGAAKAELDERRCPEIWLAYDDLRVARVALIAVITATEAGQCAGVSRSVSHCNAAGAIVDVVKASSAVATAVKEHRK